MFDKENEILKEELVSQETNTVKNLVYSTEEQKALHDILNKTYPIINSNNIKPLSIGFIKELQEKTGLSKERLKGFLRWYCGSKYQKILKAGELRYNLNGEIVGEVSISEEHYAQLKLNSNNSYYVLDRLFIILINDKDLKKLEALLKAGFRPSKNLLSENLDILNLLVKYDIK